MSYDQVSYWESKYKKLQRIALISTFAGTMIGIIVGKQWVKDTHEPTLKTLKEDSRLITHPPIVPVQKEASLILH